MIKTQGCKVYLKDEAGVKGRLSRSAAWSNQGGSKSKKKNSYV